MVGVRMGVAVASDLADVGSGFLVDADASDCVKSEFSGAVGVGMGSDS